MNKINKPFKDYVHSIYPKGSIIQKYGILAPIYLTLGLKSHNGIDIVNTVNKSYGTEILCVEKGVVVWVEEKPNGFGTHCKIISDSGEWTYGHLSELKVKLNQIVQAGEVVGLMGNSGMTSRGVGDNKPIYQWGNSNPDAKGTHLHLGLREFQKYEGVGNYNISYPNKIKGTILNYNNGNKGAIDFMEMLDNISPHNIKNTKERDIIKIQVLNVLLKYVENPYKAFVKFLKFYK